MAEGRLGSEELQAAIHTNWERLLADLAALDEEARQQAAVAQGFASVAEFLGHIAAWLEELLWAVPRLARGERVTYDWASVDGFNARAVARYRGRPQGEVTDELRELLSRVAGLIASLDEGDLANPKVYEWVYDTAVEHPGEHHLSR